MRWENIEIFHCVQLYGFAEAGNVTDKGWLLAAVFTWELERGCAKAGNSSPQVYFIEPGNECGLKQGTASLAYQTHNSPEVPEVLYTPISYYQADYD